MNQRQPSPPKVKFTDLPTDPQERHEALVDVFGHYFFSLRNWSMDLTHELVESEDSRERLPASVRARYEHFASLSDEEREMSVRLASGTLDRFMQFFLALLSNMGTDDRLDADHAVRFRLDIEIVDVESMEVVEQEAISRDGRKHFADYFGRWKNLFSK